MRLTAPAALLTAGVLTLTLTGCFSNPLEQITEGGLEGIVEQVTGGNVDVGADGTAAVPADFPSEVPLPPGSPTTSFSIDGNYQLTYAIDDASAVDSLRAQLVAAGYAELSQSDMGELKIWIHENDAHIVSVSLVDDDGDLQLAYMVGTKK